MASNTLATSSFSQVLFRSTECTWCKLTLGFRSQLDADLHDSPGVVALPPGHDVSETGHVSVQAIAVPAIVSSPAAEDSPAAAEPFPSDVEQLARHIMHQHTKVIPHANCALHAREHACMSMQDASMALSATA